MDRHRIDSTHALTPLAYSCPVCGHRARMRIASPFWECPHCYVRLIPADLNPPPAERPQQQGGIGASPQDSPTSPEPPAPLPVRLD